LILKIPNIQITTPISITLKQQLLYQTKPKTIYHTHHHHILYLQYKHSPTPFNPQNKPQIEAKRTLNNQISTFIFQMLHDKRINNHFV
ncbi:phosphoribosylaminoimidazolesuccinocarboxamide synthase, partial [Bacillus altitudinis]|uniref:phosphoribosylaminoimidazolesuccinocarboxamide synthase n=1 Tax=Bacillus altitudinis TaxID=293387 RepID=UPI002352A41D